MSEIPSLRVGILGATGAVGQKFVALLADHPWFRVTHLAASERSAGRAYRDVVNWTASEPMPEKAGRLEVASAEPPLDCDFVFSGLDASVAGEIEGRFAAAGIPVISNARNYRMQTDVPLLIPEVNPDHVELVRRQRWSNGGFIVTNPNCSTVGLVVALKPLHDAFGLDTVQVTTMQALSGAGYPGVPSLDILGNVIPFIGGEEAKMETEPLKLLGTLADDGVKPATFNISAQCNRVPVLDGHLECVSVKLSRPASVEEVRSAFDTFQSPTRDFQLPSEPERVVRYFADDRFPQPRLHAGLGAGMTVSIGRLRPCPVLDFKFVVLSHNTIRGAAGGAILNAELLVRQGLLQKRVPTEVAV